jgi:hypothetical protein
MPENKVPIGRRKLLKAASLASTAMLSARVAKAEEPTPTIALMLDPETGAEPFSPDAPPALW